MAKIAQASQSIAKKTHFFSIEVPAKVRINIEASNDEEAREIITAILGGGIWERSDEIGIPFALKTE